MRQAAHGFLDADQVFRRRQVPQCIADLGEALLQRSERVVVSAGLAAFVDALGERLSSSAGIREFRFAEAPGLRPRFPEDMDEPQTGQSTLRAFLCAS